MPKACIQTEDRIQDAVVAYRHAQNPKISDIAREFDVDYQCLRQCLKGVPSKFQTTPINYTLNKHQENALRNWVYQLDRAGCPPNAQQVEKCANSFLRRSHTNPRSKPLEVGQKWAYRFIKRLPNEYKLRKQKPIDPKRMNAEDIGVIEDWYDHLDAAMR